MYVHPLAQHTAVSLAKLLSHFEGSGVGPALPATSRPGQSPIPTDCQALVGGTPGVGRWLRPVGGGVGTVAEEGTGAGTAAQVYIWPGLGPPVHEPVATFLYVHPVVQHTAVLPAKLALHFDGSGLGPLLPATSRPGQSPSPTDCQVPSVGAGSGVVTGWAAQVYIWPGFAPPVHDPVATFLYVQPVVQHTAVLPANLALHFEGSGFGPVVPATSRPGQSPSPTDCHPPAECVGAVAAQVYI